jgi:hypothetical protein
MERNRVRNEDYDWWPWHCHGQGNPVPLAAARVQAKRLNAGQRSRADASVVDFAAVPVMIDNQHDPNTEGGQDEFEAL